MCYDTEELVKRIMEKKIRVKRRKLILKAVIRKEWEKEREKKGEGMWKEGKGGKQRRKIASQSFKTFHGI